MDRRRMLRKLVMRMNLLKKIALLNKLKLTNRRMQIATKALVEHFELTAAGNPQILSYLRLLSDDNTTVPMDMMPSTSMGGSILDEIHRGIEEDDGTIWIDVTPREEKDVSIIDVDADSNYKSPTESVITDDDGVEYKIDWLDQSAVNEDSAVKNDVDSIKIVEDNLNQILGEEVSFEKIIVSDNSNVTDVYKKPE
nr:uncharacterized protein LOC111425525 [Onthophagus taurus]